MRITINKNLTCAILFFYLVHFEATALDLGTYGNTTVTVKGSIKFQFISNTYNYAGNGENLANSWVRDYYVPAAVIRPGEVRNTQTVFDTTVRQSIFGVGTSTKLDSGKSIDTWLEIDFENINNPGINERIANSAVPRIRIAKVGYDGFEFGQDWTTYLLKEVFPDTVVFIFGVADGTVFIRQPLIRYSTDGFTIALENPATTVIGGRNGSDGLLTLSIDSLASGGQGIADDSRFPDLVLRYLWKDGDYLVALRLLYRELGYRGRIGGSDRLYSLYTKATGYGISTKINFDGGDVRFTLDSGNLGRYVGLNAIHDATLAVTSSSQLSASTTESDISFEPTTTHSYTFAVRWFYNSSVRSNIVFSGQRADLDNSINGTSYALSQRPTFETSSWLFNVKYEITDNFLVGFEFGRGRQKKLAERDVNGSQVPLSGIIGTVRRYEIGLFYIF